ncbi:PPIP5K2.2 family protein [Megaselia abdita]
MESSSHIKSETYTHETSIEDVISTSLADNDGLLDMQLHGEVTKLFPKLEDHLYVVDFNLDCLTPVDVEKNACLTPTSMYLDISTTATKGSTNISFEDNDEDDEEATLSAATTPSLPIDEKDFTSNNPTFDDCAIKIIAIDGITSANDQIESSSTIKSEEHGSPGILKQISIFEKELKSSTSDCFRRPIYPALNPNRRKKFESLECFFMSQSSSNTNLSHYSLQRDTISSIEKFRSCSNLKNPTTTNSSNNTLNQINKLSNNQQQLQNQHHPGALVVKQKLIEPPKKITRGIGLNKTRSVDCEIHFHDNCESPGKISSDVGSSCIAVLEGSKSVRDSSKPLCFLTPKTDEAAQQKNANC